MLWCSQEELFPFQDIERRGEERKLFHERRGVGSVGWAVWVVRGSQSFSSSGLNYDIWNSLNFIHPLPDTPLLAFFNKNKKEKKKKSAPFLSTDTPPPLHPTFSNPPPTPTLSTTPSYSDLTLEEWFSGDQAPFCDRLPCFHSLCCSLCSSSLACLESLCK